MTVVTSISKNARAKNAAVEADEFEGLWMNPGIFVGDEENSKFVRFNRGIAISDLKTRKLYESMDPDFAAEQQLLNDRVEAIRARALTLEEGEHIVINIPMVLYRRQEEADVAPTPKAAKADIDKELFG
jgi:acid phosphatase class B